MIYPSEIWVKRLLNVVNILSARTQLTESKTNDGSMRKWTLQYVGTLFLIISLPAIPLRSKVLLEVKKNVKLSLGEKITNERDFQEDCKWLLLHVKSGRTEVMGKQALGRDFYRREVHDKRVLE